MAERHESIYEATCLVELREKFRDKTVLMIDLDGVLRGTPDDAEAADPKAILALRELVKVGYTLTLWTQTENRDGDVDRFLDSNELNPLFDLVVCLEDHELLEPAQRDAYLAALDSATWLDDETRAGFNEYLDELLKHKGVLPPKTPHFIFERCGIIDDGAAIWWTRFSASVRDLTRRQSGQSPYHWFYVRDSRMPHTQTDEHYFGPSWIDRIKREFPLKS
ncbi:MAG: hypothetical protein WC897_05235 [Candidatus Gracilibacteria bacterium]